MKRNVIIAVLLLFCFAVQAQTVAHRLQTAYEKFAADPQLSNALSSLYVINSKTGQVVFDRNSRIGLATASTMKIITAASAYAFLGKDFRYETDFGYVGKIDNGMLAGDFYVSGSGDPTFGSWRYESTNEKAVLDEFSSAVRKSGITVYNDVVIDDGGWDAEAIPDGWIWQDVGNYYGAGAHGLNWRENQYDIFMRSGRSIGDAVSVVKTEPDFGIPLVSKVRSAASGTGDNSYVFYPLLEPQGVIRGTIPVNQSNFSISATNPIPKLSFARLLSHQLTSELKLTKRHFENHLPDTTVFYKHYSPALDSIVYWFLKKSINLYGEALAKTIAFREALTAETAKGVELIRDFWKDKGVVPTELNMVDGSGLSPVNRVTTHAQVTVLKYARAQPWFDGYYNAFPEYNGMKMKSGTISDVKGFCGYHRSRTGEEYIFSFLVNNYNGSASTLVRKMYRVLDELK